MTDKIVCATDFDEASGVAVRYAASIARAWGASLDLLHAWFSPDELPDDIAASRADVIAASRAKGHARLDAAVAELGAQGVKASAALLEGAPERAIPEYATARGASLLVIGTHAAAGLKHALVGSVAERILRVSSVPVLVVPKDVRVDEGAKFAPREILVPTDLSHGSADALRKALALGERSGARVVLLHAWDVPPYYFEDGKALDETAQRMPKHVADWLDETFDESVDFAEHDFQQIVRRGDPHDAIAETCAIRQPDLLVMATAGRRGLEHLMLGSVTPCSRCDGRPDDARGRAGHPPRRVITTRSGTSG